MDEFEVNWHIGKIAEIEQLVGKAPHSLQRELLKELILIDIDHSNAHNLKRNVDSYDQHLPAFLELFHDVKAELVDTIHAETPLAKGRVLGDRFALNKFVGAGAMGEVWKAFDLHLRRYVAIKIVNRLLFTESEIRRFVREAQAGAQLSHPNIVRVYDSGQQGSITYLIADFIEGQDLKAWLIKNRPSFERTATICRDVGSALECAHGHGIVHRDIKPANILIDKQGNVFVTDFGLAKWCDDNADLTHSGQALGTAGYMSPEQVRGKTSLIDPRADVYALGAMLYEMLVHCRPHEGQLLTIIDEILYVPPTKPRKLDRSIPLALETICLKCLEKSPRNRYQSSREVVDDLSAFLAGKPIKARRRSLAAVSMDWLRSHKTFVAILSLCVALLLAIELLRRLENRNHALMGIQNVSVSTQPEGARVAFLPITKLAGGNDGPNLICAKGTTPLAIELPHGDYKVCAVLSDGRFQEVFRHVPSNSEDETTVEVYPHRRSTRSGDGQIILPKIVIPESSIINGMEYIKGTSNFTAGQQGSSFLPAHRQVIADFFIDRSEFTLGNLKVISNRLPIRFSKADLPDDQPIEVSLDQAVAYSEASGKRLPTEFEYEYAATNLGESRFPWGDSEPELNALDAELTAAANFDRLQYAPKVTGLCTGLAEWTYSPYVPYAPHEIDAEIVSTKDVFVVRGQVMNENTTNQIERLNPRQRHGVNRHVIDSGIGFRCVRSAAPLVEFDEFDD